MSFDLQNWFDELKEEVLRAEDHQRRSDAINAEFEACRARMQELESEAINLRNEAHYLSPSPCWFEIKEHIISTYAEPTKDDNKE